MSQGLSDSTTPPALNGTALSDASLALPNSCPARQQHFKPTYSGSCLSAHAHLAFTTLRQCILQRNKAMMKVLRARLYALSLKDVRTIRTAATFNGGQHAHTAAQENIRETRVSSDEL
eukprot:2170159-Amphidinium_carterae.1